MASSQSASRLRRLGEETTLAQSVLWLLVATVGAKAVGFVRSLLTCRLLPEQELGRWDLAYGFLLLAAPVIMLGIPGSFGRYLEHFARRRSLRRMLRSCLLVLAGLTLLGTGLLLLFPGFFAWLVLDLPQQRAFIFYLAAALGLSMWMFVLQEIFGGLRRFRLVASLQALHTLLFAGVSLVLLLFWRAEAVAVLAGFAAAAAACTGLGLWWLRNTWNELPADRLPQPAFPLWQRMMQFALWVWLTNWLANLFQVMDRYMLLHLGRLAPEQALAQVGNYHAAWVLPLVVITVAGVVHSALVPHLSRSWESGRRGHVRRTLRRFVRLGALALCLALLGIQVLRGPMYDWFLQGKYPLAGDVLAWISVLAAWAVLALLVGCYLWCAERAQWETAAVAVALLLNGTLNALLIPRWQLQGAVVATTGAHLGLLLVMLAVAARQGWRMRRREHVLLFAPAALLLGLWALAAVTLLLVVDLWRGHLFFPRGDRQLIADMLRQLGQRLGRKAGGAPASQAPPPDPVCPPVPVPDDAAPAVEEPLPG